MQQTIVSKMMTGQDQRYANRFNQLVHQGAHLNQNMGTGVNLRQIGGQIPTDPLQLMEQNQNIRIMLENIKSQRSLISNPSIIISNPDEPTMTAEIEHAFNTNNLRIIELQTVIRNQQVAIGEYQRGFLELQANIENLRVLDSDIYKRLNERDNTQFQNRIIEVKKALRSNAPYQVLLSMLNDIKI